MNEHTPRLTPVSSSLSITMAIIYLLYYFKVLTSIPCNKTIKDVFYGQFVHVDSYHLLFNLYTLYTLNRIELEMGYKPFMYLLIFLLIFNTIVEFVLRLLFKGLKCSIGFSGILFGFISWDIASKKKLDIELLISILLLAVIPTSKGEKVSLAGHVIGAVSGVFAALLWKRFNQ